MNSSMQSPTSNRSNCCKTIRAATYVDVAAVNAAAVALVRQVAQLAQHGQMILAGVISPASDGYAIGEALNADDAFAYHSETWARHELACAREVDLTILGCCGADYRSIEALAKQAVQEG